MATDIDVSSAIKAIRHVVDTLPYEALQSDDFHIDHLMHALGTLLMIEAERTAGNIPPHGLMMSMALRHDHALGMPGYYDQEILGGEPGHHRRRVSGALMQMRQLWEEVTGRGFYSPDKELAYAQMADRLLGKADAKPL